MKFIKKEKKGYRRKIAKDTNEIKKSQQQRYVTKTSYKYSFQ